MEYTFKFGNRIPLRTCKQSVILMKSSIKNAYGFRRMNNHVKQNEAERTNIKMEATIGRSEQQSQLNKSRRNIDRVISFIDTQI